MTSRACNAARRAVDDLLTLLEDQGQLDNTLVVFMSDNGYLWGEHRLAQEGEDAERLQGRERVAPERLLEFLPLPLLRHALERRAQLARNLAGVAEDPDGDRKEASDGRRIELFHVGGECVGSSEPRCVKPPRSWPT